MPGDLLLVVLWGLLAHQISRLWPAAKAESVSSPSIKGLASALRDLKAFSSETSSLAQDVATTLSEGARTIGHVKSTHSEIKSALAEVQAELGAITNGGPPLDDAAATFSPAPPAQPDAGQFNQPHTK